MNEQLQSNVLIGLTNPKNPQNVGSVLRAAGNYGASQILYTGQRYANAKKYYTDTQNRGATIPVAQCNNLIDTVAGDYRIVAIELVEGAIPLPAFEHPPKALYIFGPEDGTIDQADLDRCDYVVYIPTIGCMNLAATVNVVLYDRMAKSSETEYGNHVIRRSRDTNNTVVVHSKSSEK